MSEVINNEENRAKLAQEVVDSWEMDTLASYAIDHLIEYYKHDNDGFQEDWENTILQGIIEGTDEEG